MDAGERWGCLVIDRASRAVVTHTSGPRDGDLVTEAVQTTQARTNGVGLPWCSDGWRAYLEILTHCYRAPVPTGKPGRPPLVVPSDLQLTQTIKHRDAQGNLEWIETRTVLGAPIDAPGTVHVERQNGVLRDRLNALTRKTHAFAKRDATWDALLTLAVWDHNWRTPQLALRLPVLRLDRRYLPQSPMMALGLTDHLWSWVEFLTCSVRAFSS